jgi:hypothetical protein
MSLGLNPARGLGMSFVFAKFYIRTRFTRLLPYFAERVLVLVIERHMGLAAPAIRFPLCANLIDVSLPLPCTSWISIDRCATNSLQLQLRSRKCTRCWCKPQCAVARGRASNWGCGAPRLEAWPLAPTS